MSRATVSYVLNDVDGQTIPEHTRMAVREAAERLGYRPNLAARSLKTGRSQLVVFAVPGFAVPGIEQVVGRLTGSLAARGVALVGHFESPHSPSLAQLVDLLHPSAVLSLTPLEPALQQVIAGKGIRVVNAATPEGIGGVYELLGSLQAEHLLELGHRRVAYAQTSDPLLHDLSSARYAAVARAFEVAGLPPLLVDEFSADGRGTAETLRRWHAIGVTAICAYNDEVAYAVLRGIRLAGLRCPDDLAVIGVDDMPFNLVSEPPLTSVAWDFDSTILMLTKVLLDALGIEADITVGPVGFRVSARESTAAV